MWDERPDCGNNVAVVAASLGLIVLLCAELLVFNHVLPIYGRMTLMQSHAFWLIPAPLTPFNLASPQEVNKGLNKLTDTHH